MKQSWMIVLVLGLITGCGKTEAPPAASTAAAEQPKQSAEQPDANPEAVAWYTPHYEQFAKWDAPMAMNFSLSRKKQKLIGIDKLPEVLEVEGTLEPAKEFSIGDKDGRGYPGITVFVILNEKGDRGECTFFMTEVKKVKAVPKDQKVTIRGTFDSHSGDQVRGIALTRCELVEDQ